MNKLAHVLNSINEYNWSYALYLPEDEVWSGDTNCMILDPNDVEDDSDEAPKIAIDNKMMYALDVQTIQSIVDNFKEQKKEFNNSELVEAFLYYYDNDAYIVI